jgi:hypothetical protein
MVKHRTKILIFVYGLMAHPMSMCLWRTHFKYLQGSALLVSGAFPHHIYKGNAENDHFFSLFFFFCEDLISKTEVTLLFHIIHFSCVTLFFEWNSYTVQKDFLHYPFKRVMYRRSNPPWPVIVPVFFCFCLKLPV